MIRLNLYKFCTGNVVIGRHIGGGPDIIGEIREIFTLDDVECAALQNFPSCAIRDCIVPRRKLTSEEEMIWRLEN